MTQSREYCSYHAAKSRCENTANPGYESHGGRGIKFLLPSFEEFLAIIGPRPEGTRLGRINNDGHYEIGNVGWHVNKGITKPTCELCQLLHKAQLGG